MTVILEKALIDTGLAANSHLLDLGHLLAVPYDFRPPAPWSLPSRLFRAPIEVGDLTDDGHRTIGLMHPDLGEHPYVQHVEQVLGVQLRTVGAPDRNGVSNVTNAAWFHAGDLMTTAHWRGLLASARFTTSDRIAQAISQNLRVRGQLSLAAARETLHLIGAAPPSSRRAVLSAFRAPFSLKLARGATGWPVNLLKHGDKRLHAWAMVIAIEEGWFAYGRSGHIECTRAGRDKFGGGPRLTLPTTAPAQQLGFTF